MLKSITINVSANDYKYAHFKLVDEMNEAGVTKDNIVNIEIKSTITMINTVVLDAYIIMEVE